MKNWLVKLSRKWIILGVICLLLLFSGVAYGANLIVIHFGGGLGISGRVTVISPPPTVADIVVLETPQFTIVAGSTDIYSGNIRVQNNSAYPLHLENVALQLADPTLGTIAWDSASTNTTVLAHLTENIRITFQLAPLSTVGNYEYSGELIYSW